jgi:hypothetical protein
MRGEFHGSCIDPVRNGEASYADPNGAIDATVKAKLDNYQHDYSERNFLFLPAVMTTSGRISGDFLRLLYILAHCYDASLSIQTRPLLPLRFRSTRVHATPASVCWRAQSTVDSLFFIDVPTNPGPHSFCARPVR